jgi:hypothetical protein
VTVQTVIGNIDLAPNKPPGERLIPFKDLCPRFEPIEVFRDVCPESLRVLNRTLVNSIVFLTTLDVSAATEFRAWFKASVFSQRRADVSGLRHYDDPPARGLKRSSDKCGTVWKSAS